MSVPLGAVAATSPSPAAGAVSVFAGADVCRTAGLALLPEAVRPVYDNERWDFSGLADAPREMTEREKRWDFSGIDNPRWRPVIKDLLLALLAPHDDRVLAVPAAFRTVRSPRTCHLYLRRAITWIEAVSRLAAQHDELLRLRQQTAQAGQVRRLPTPR